MTNNLSLLLKKYSVPAIFALIGIGMLILGLLTGQNAIWFISSLLVLISGIITILQSSGLISKSMAIGLGIGSGVAAVCVLIANYFTVVNEVAYQKDFATSQAQADAHLQDVRTAQKAYVEKNRKYAASFEDLKEFIKTGQVDELISEGVIPARKLSETEFKLLYPGKGILLDNNMTEREALRLSKMPSPSEDLIGFKRDTAMVSVYKKYFASRSYLESRAKIGLGKFKVEELQYVPFSNKKLSFQIVTKDSIPGGTGEPVLFVSGVYAIGVGTNGKPLPVSFGSEVTPGLKGTWEDR